MKRDRILQAVTGKAAAFLKMDDRIGRILPGMEADITVLKDMDVARVYTDCLGKEITVRKQLVPMLTIFGGKVVYRSLEF